MECTEMKHLGVCVISKGTEVKQNKIKTYNTPPPKHVEERVPRAFPASVGKNRFPAKFFVCWYRQDPAL